MSAKGLSENSYVTKLIDIYYHKPAISKPSIIAQPKSKNFAIVGTAFDYLTRFLIESTNKDKTTTRNSWVLEAAPMNLLAEAKIRKEALIELDEYHTIIQDAKKVYSSCRKTGSIVEDDIVSILKLAPFEHYFRCMILGHDYRDINQNDIEDIRNLLDIFHNKLWVANHHVVINPCFGEGSLLVGGADIDMVIDDMLLDVKTTQKFFEAKHLRQMIIYYFLYRIGGIEGCEYYNDPEAIKKLGLYYSRYGELVQINIADIITEKSYKIFESLLKYYLDTSLEYFDEDDLYEDNALPLDDESEF